MISKPVTDRWIPLSELQRNQSARVMELAGDESSCHRVEEMGLRAGAAICMLRREAPQIISIDGRRVSFRLNGCLEVWVKPQEGDAELRSAK